MALVFFLVRGCGCGRKTKSRARARVALSFCGWPRGQIRTRRTGPHPKPFKRPSHVACRLRWPLAVLSSRAAAKKKPAPCHEPRSEARRRRRRRDTTKPTTHANDSPRRTSAASNGALIRLRQVENQSAPLPCLPFISHRRRAVHGANGKFHLVENLGIRSECGVIVIILNKTYH